MGETYEIEHEPIRLILRRWAKECAYDRDVWPCTAGRVLRGRSEANGLDPAATLLLADALPASAPELGPGDAMTTVRDYPPAAVFHDPSKCDDDPAEFECPPQVVAAAHPNARPHTCLNRETITSGGRVVVEQVEYEPHPYAPSTIQSCEDGIKAARPLCEVCRGTHGTAWLPQPTGPALIIARPRGDAVSDVIRVMRDGNLYLRLHVQSSGPVVGDWVAHHGYVKHADGGLFGGPWSERRDITAKPLGRNVVEMASSGPPLAVPGPELVKNNVRILAERAAARLATSPPDSTKRGEP